MAQDGSSKNGQACVTCHNRKIRCVVDEDGPSCRTCRIANIDCIMRSRKKRRLNTLLPRQPEVRNFTERLNLPESQQAQFSAKSTLIPVDHSTTNNPTAYATIADRPSDAFLTTQAIRPEPWTRSTRPERFSSRAAPVEVPHTTLNSDVDYVFGDLPTNPQIPSHAVDVPLRSVRQTLTNTFLQYCNPWLPVMEHSDLANLAQIEQQSAPMLLAQSLWFAASCMNQSSSAPSHFYENAKALFWSGSQRDPLVAIKAALLLMSYDRQATGYDIYDNSELWLHVTITIAYRIKLHQDPPPDSRSGIRRRLWWTMVAQDSLMSFLYDRPRVINLTDSDVRDLCETDFINSPTCFIAFTLHVHISNLLGDLMECYRRRSMDYSHRSSIENTIRLLRARLCQYEKDEAEADTEADTEADVFGPTDQSLTVRQLKLPYFTALVLFAKFQNSLSTTKGSNTSSLEVSAVASIAASLSARIFKTILEHNESQYLGPVFTVYAYSASMALLRLWAYPMLWRAAQPDLQTLREALLSFAGREPSVTDATKALDNALTHLKTIPQYRPAYLPSVSDQTLFPQFFDCLSPTSCRMWNAITELIADSSCIGADRTIEAALSRDMRAESLAVFQSEPNGCDSIDLLPTRAISYRQFDDLLLHDS